MLQLTTLGKPTSITLDVQDQTKRILSIKLAIEMKVEWDLSERQFFGVLKYIRMAFGKPSIEVGLKSALRDHNTLFADIFTMKFFLLVSTFSTVRRRSGFMSLFRARNTYDDGILKSNLVLTRETCERVAYEHVKYMTV